MPMSCCKGRSADLLAAPKPTAPASLFSLGGPAANDPSLPMLGTGLMVPTSWNLPDKEEEERARPDCGNRFVPAVERRRASTLPFRLVLVGASALQVTPTRVRCYATDQAMLVSGSEKFRPAKHAAVHIVMTAVIHDDVWQLYCIRSDSVQHWESSKSSR